MIQELKGESYFSVLNRIHLELKPARYLEIGVAKGQSLTLVKEGCYAVGVDPEPAISCGFLAWTQVYEMTSDEFFSTYKGAPFDLIFIDGLHQYEMVAKDFCGAEKLTHENSVIILHDTIPKSKETSQPAFKEGFWTGDVWKIIPLLREARPDLTLLTIPCPPSGLTLLSGFSTPKGFPEGSIEKHAAKDFDWAAAHLPPLLNIRT